MRIRGVAVAFAAALVAVPASAAASPKIVARPGRLDYGPVLAGGRVVYAATPYIRRVQSDGHAVNLPYVIPAPEEPQPAQAHAATPEGTDIYGSDLLDFSSDGVAWQSYEDRVDPVFYEQKQEHAVFRPHVLDANGSVGLGGWYATGNQDWAGGGATPLVCDEPNSSRSLSALALSDQALLYVAQDPAPTCADDAHPTRVKLILRTLSQDTLGPEQVLGEGAPAAYPNYPFSDLHAAGAFVSWLTPRGSARWDAAVADASTGKVVYTVADIAPTGIELGPDGTLAIGLADGTLEWASPAAPAPHPLGQGTPLAVAGANVLLDGARGLALRPLDGTADRPVPGSAGRRAGAADYDGTQVTWATLGKHCKRVRVKRRGHRHRHRHPRYRRVCKREYRIHLAATG
jgi:hypothetical protein